MVSLPTTFSTITRHPLLYPPPSPVEPLPRLSSRLFSIVFIGSSNSSAQSSANSEVKPQLWIKREDSNSGLAGGGNKVRKLECVVPDVLSRGATTWVTTGGLQSNHMRQVTAVARKLGLKVVFVFGLLVF